MKKIIFFLAVLCLAMTLCACGTDGTSGQKITDASQKDSLIPQEGEIAGTEQLEAWTKVDDVTKTVEKDEEKHTLCYYKYTEGLTQYVFFVDEETKQVEDVRFTSLKKLPKSERLDPKKNYGEINYEKNKDSYTNWTTKDPKSSNKKNSSSGNIKNNKSKDYNLSEDFNDWPEDDFVDEIEAEEYWEDYYDYEENDWEWDE